jgi:O-antigen/teichoic acid export membrane protein
MGTKTLIATNTVSQLIGKVIGALFTLVVTVTVARTMGASGYGDFVKVTTYVAFFYLLADFGLNAVFLQQSDDPKSWSALVGLRTMGSVLLMAIAIGITYLLPGSTGQGYTAAVRLGILLFSPTIFFQALIVTANAMFQKRLRYDFATWGIFFGSIVGATTLFATSLVSLTQSLTPLLIGSGVTAMVSIFFAQKMQKELALSFQWQKAKKILIASLPLGLTLLFNVVYFRADSIIMTISRPTAEVGLYGLAYKVFEFVLVFPTFFMNAVYPLMLTAPSLRKLVRSSFLFLLAVSIIGSLVLYVGAPYLSLIKADFAASVPALRVLSLGLPIFFLSSLAMWILIAKKKQAVLMAIYGISMAINIIANAALIPQYGYMAAAWITVASEALVLVLSGFVISREWNPRQ